MVRQQLNEASPGLIKRREIDTEGNVTDVIDVKEAYAESIKTYGRFEDAVKYINPRKE